MKWVSIDPANSAGVAFWDDDKLHSTCIIKARGGKGAYYGAIGEICQTKHLAWLSIVTLAEQIIMEEGFGARAKVVASQGHLRGYITAIADSRAVPVSVVNVSEWRRIIKDGFGVSWPREREGCKALSKSIVKQVYGIDVSDDESDAVLLGYAALRMRRVDLTKDAAWDDLHAVGH